MVNVEAAVQIATGMLIKVMPAYAALEPTVEEFALSGDGSVWNVTFRAINPDADKPKGFAYFPYKEKLVQIKTSDGELVAIRNPTYE